MPTATRTRTHTFTVASRTLSVVSPLQHGDDVKLLQRALNERLRARRSKVVVGEDGEFGPATLRACQKAGYLLGAKSATFHSRVVSIGLQLMIVHPERRSVAQLQRAHQRAARLEQIRTQHNIGAAGALREAKRCLGTTEHPPGSNTGPRIDDWNRDVGTPPGPFAYWCGAFCHHLLRTVGFPRMTWMAYCPNIEAHARAGVDGWKWYGPDTAAQPGWLALYTEKGIAGHVEMVEDDEKANVEDIGGNTSSDNRGSQSNGGGVFRKSRFKRAAGFPLRGYAAPPYYRYAKAA